DALAARRRHAGPRGLFGNHGARHHRHRAGRSCPEAGERHSADRFTPPRRDDHERLLRRLRLGHLRRREPALLEGTAQPSGWACSFPGFHRSPISRPWLLRRAVSTMDTSMIEGDVMKRAFIFIAGAVILAAAVFASGRLFAASGPSSAAASSAAVARPCGDLAQYGHIKSLTRAGDHFEMRFDPAWFLSGVTASRAKLEDTGSSDVPNDNYVVEEGHRLLTYVVPATAEITVLSRTGELPGAGFPSTAITASQLSQLVDGKEPVKIGRASCRERVERWDGGGDWR